MGECGLEMGIFQDAACALPWPLSEIWTIFHCYNIYGSAFGYAESKHALYKALLKGLNVYTKSHAFAYSALECDAQLWGTLTENS